MPIYLILLVFYILILSQKCRERHKGQFAGTTWTFFHQHWLPNTQIVSFRDQQWWRRKSVSLTKSSFDSPVRWDEERLTCSRPSEAKPDWQPAGAARHLDRSTQRCPHPRLCESSHTQPPNRKWMQLAGDVWCSLRSYSFFFFLNQSLNLTH